MARAKKKRPASVRRAAARRLFAVADEVDAIAELLEQRLLEDDDKPAAAGAGAELAPVLLAVQAASDPRVGLSFVPDVVRALGGSPRSAKAALVAAADAGLLELRPEGGLGRLSREEIALCPAGPHGTVLSWARVLR